MSHAVENSGVRLRQAVHYVSFHRISLILSPDVSFHCVGINRIAKHRRYLLGKGTKSDEFLEKLQGGEQGGPFSIKKFTLQILNL